MKNSLRKDKPKALAKAIVDAKTDKVLGFHMVSPNAAEIIQVGVACRSLLECPSCTMLSIACSCSPEPGFDTSCRHLRRCNSDLSRKASLFPIAVAV